MLTIEQARPADWPNILSGLARTPLDEGPLISAVNATFLVARKGAKFAGFCMVVQLDDIGLLPALFVETAFRRGHIAKQLVATSIAYASANGARWLFTGCQPYGVPFLERLGFEIERRYLIPVSVLERLEAAGGAELTLMSMQGISVAPDRLVPASALQVNGASVKAPPSLFVS